MKRIALLATVLILLLSACGTSAESGAGSASSSAAERLEGSESSSPSAPEGEEETSLMEEDLPDNDWEFDTPENHGVNPQLLQALHAAVEDVEEIRSIVTVKDGVVIDEYYGAEYDENTVFGLASCTKSFSGILIGIAIDQGLIPGVDVKLTEYFPQLADAGEEAKRDITLEHILTQTSGIEWHEWNGGASFGELRRADNWVDFYLGKPMAAEPGTVFNYSTGGSHLLSAIIQEASGKNELEFAREHLFSPLGMNSVEWRVDPQGIMDGGNGISMTARDAAKFGQLILDGGSWRGRQIIPRAWVETSVKVHFERSGQNGSYGYQWWIRPFGRGNYDTYFAMGHGGNYIFVVPEQRLVTVMTCRFGDTYAPFSYFSDFILDACE